MVPAILRLEGLALLLASIWFFFSRLHAPWWLFIALILAPDLAMLGYLRGPRLGSITYNSVHNTVLALGLIVAGTLTDSQLLVEAGVILLEHLGLDLTAGYGLKYPSRFQDTHFQRM